MKKAMPFMGKESKKEEMMEKKKGGKAAYAKGEKKEAKGKEMMGKMKMLMKAKKK
jgi:hypothetical protein